MWDPGRPWVVNSYNLQSDLARYSYVDTNQNLLPCLLKIAFFLLVTDSSGELNLAKDDIELLRHVDCRSTRVAITGTMVALGPPKFTFTGLMLQFCCAALFNVVVLVGTRFFTAIWNINCAEEIKIACTSDAHCMACEIINYLINGDGIPFKGSSQWQLGVTLASVNSLFAIELCHAIARGNMSTESSLLSSNLWKMSGIFSSILGGGYMSSVHQVALSENYDAHIYLTALPNNFLTSNLSLMLLKVTMILAGQRYMLKHSKIIILRTCITALVVGLERIVQEAQVKCASIHATILTCCLMICVDVGPKFVHATVATISCHVDKIVIAHICSSYFPEHLCLEIFGEECAATIVLDSNLEDKVLFEGESIVVNHAYSIRAYGLEKVNEAESVGIYWAE